MWSSVVVLLCSGLYIVFADDMLLLDIRIFQYHGGAYCDKVQPLAIVLNKQFRVGVRSDFEIESIRCERDWIPNQTTDIWETSDINEYNLFFDMQATSEMFSEWHCSFHLWDQLLSQRKTVNCQFSLVIDEKIKKNDDQAITSQLEHPVQQIGDFKPVEPGPHGQSKNLTGAERHQEKQKDNPDSIYIYAACGAVVVALVGAVLVVLGLRKRKQWMQNKRDSKQALAETNDAPPLGPMSAPSQPEEVYATPIDTLECETYSVPYVPASVHELYTKPQQIKPVYVDLQFDRPCKEVQRKASEPAYATVQELDRAQDTPTRMRSDTSAPGLTQDEPSYVNCDITAT